MFIQQQDIQQATYRLFSESAAPLAPDQASTLIVDFQKTIQDATSDEGFFYRSAREEVVFPIAQNVAFAVRRALTDELVASGATPAQMERLHKLADAFQGVAKSLDHFAALGDEPSYHNREHNLMIMAIRLVRGRSLRAGKGGKADDIIREMRDLVAAIGHDLGHDGTTNRTGNVYVPGRLEMSSNALVQTCLTEAGCTAPDKLYIERSLMATDPDLPGQIAAYAYRMHYGTAPLALTRGALDDKIKALPEPQQKTMNDFMKALERDPRLTASAMALKSADMVPSFGLCDAMWRQMSVAFHAEVVKQTPDRPVLGADGTPKATGQLFVMLNFVGAEMCSHATHVGPRAQQFLQARFMDPETDRLFGPYLRYLQERMTQKAGKDAAPIYQGFAASHQLALR